MEFVAQSRFVPCSVCQELETLLILSTDTACASRATAGNLCACVASEAQSSVATKAPSVQGSSRARLALSGSCLQSVRGID